LGWATSLHHQEDKRKLHETVGESIVLSQHRNNRHTDVCAVDYGGAENAGVENTGAKNVARRKTQALYVKVFEEVSALVSQFAASCAVADFEAASVSAFHHVFQDAGVVGCWFH